MNKWLFPTSPEMRLIHLDAKLNVNSKDNESIEFLLVSPKRSFKELG